MEGLLIFITIFATFVPSYGQLDIKNMRLQEFCKNGYLVRFAIYRCVVDNLEDDSKKELEELEACAQDTLNAAITEKCYVGKEDKIKLFLKCGEEGSSDLVLDVDEIGAMKCIEKEFTG